jgi:hypothetical protein
LRGRRFIVIQAPELSELIESAELLREEDTCIAGPIRMLRVGRLLLVQEQAPETKDLIVREFSTTEEAERFLAERLGTYERMWDGCGCKIDYYK